MTKFIESINKLSKAVERISPKMTKIERATLIMGLTNMLRVLEVDQEKKVK